MSNEDMPGNVPLSEQLGLDAMRPACWTPTETLDANMTTTSGRLWFTDPKNTAWEPLYRRSALLRVLENAKAVQQHNAELMAEHDRLRVIVPEVLERLNDELCAENERMRAALTAIGLRCAADAQSGEWANSISHVQALVKSSLGA